MADVFVPYGKSATDTAVLLLAEAEKQGLDPGVVQSQSDGGFMVPEEVASAVNGGDAAPKKKAPAKKAAKKAAAKKSSK